MLGDIYDMVRLEKKVFHHETKRNFNILFKDATKLRRLINISPDGEQVDFAEDAEHMEALILAVIDRVGDDDTIMKKIYEFVKALPSKGLLDLQRADDAYEGIDGGDRGIPEETTEGGQVPQDGTGDFAGVASNNDNNL
jgi:hypothetical protein